MAATKTYTSGHLAIALPAGATIEHAIDVPDAGPVSRVAVSVRLGHTNPADLAVTLVGPDGTAVLLQAGRAKGFGSGGRDCEGQFVVFEDEFSPARERLARFDGKEARGSWKLRIETAPRTSVGTLFCWKLDLSRDVVETVAAEAGNVAAELSFVERSYNYRDVRLTVRRDGSLIVDAPLAGVVCDDCPAEGSLLFTSEKPLSVRDLDLDGEPEVLVDLYTGGAHCCVYTLILYFRGGIYWPIDGWWGNYDYSLQDYDRDGRPEFLALDDRFAYAFTAFAFSVPPIQIWRFDRGRWIDVTRTFPAVVAQNARWILRIYERERKRKPPEVRGVLAAYVATQYVLGRPQAGWRVVERAYRRGELGRDRTKDSWPTGRAYLRALRAFLRETGYIR